MRTARLGFKVIAAGFALGAVVHAGEAIAAIAGYHLREYPLWRHCVFVLLDGAFAVLALRAPHLLWMPLLALLAQQSTTHGYDVWRVWRDGHAVAWLSLTTMTFVIASAVFALRYRVRHRALSMRSPLSRG